MYSVLFQLMFVHQIYFYMVHSGQMLKAGYIKMRFEGDDTKNFFVGFTILIDAYKSKKWKIYNYVVKW